VSSVEDLAVLLKFIQGHHIPWYLLGKGSNLLIADETWPGIVLRLGSAFKQWEIQTKERTVCAGSALASVTFVQRCVPLGWGGLEFLIGVPGTIGGAIAMNAGAHGGEVHQFLKRVWWMDLEGILHQSEVESIDFSYRHSALNARYETIIIQGLFQLEDSDQKTIQSKIRDYQTFRLEHQPKRQPNCGSVFKNPPGHYAAKLIETSGLKGSQIGDAQISQKHANFIVNLGNASARDVLQLIELARNKVYQDHGISLELEVQILQAFH
jgi:UDP-N-acetylmuramate dehydrogenase